MPGTKVIIPGLPLVHNAALSCNYQDYQYPTMDGLVIQPLLLYTVWM